MHPKPQAKSEALGGVGGGVRPAGQNPYPIYDQNLRYPLRYLWPDF